MSRNLDESRARDISTTMIAVLEDEGFSTEEMIPGFIQGVIDLAHGDDALLDEAANLLADGGVSDE